MYNIDEKEAAFGQGLKVRSIVSKKTKKAKSS
jgi:hypothetical protein